MLSKKKKILEAISLEVLLVSVLFIVSIFAFAFLAKGVVEGREEKFDNSVFSFFDQFSSPSVISVMRVVSFFGSIQFLIPAYITMIAYFIMRKKYRNAVDITIIAITSSALMFALKTIFHRQRPDLPIIKGIYTYSFPSGHALSSFIFCSILVFIIQNGVWKKLYKWMLSILLLACSITIGISRIILRAHYPTDVIASFFLGIVWVIVSLWLLKKINRQYMIRQNLSSVKT
jgi:membrane-associated phospholipid phosphatase